jgi:hypothetical protein
MTFRFVKKIILFSRVRQALAIGSLALFGAGFSIAQQPSSDDAPLKIGKVVFSGSVRTRTEGWDWFSSGKGENAYGYSETLFRFGFSETSDNLDWKAEFAMPVLLALPGHSVDAGSQGQLGFGGTYYAVNGKSTNTAMLFAKQLYLKFHGGDHIKQSLELGRTEFVEGVELIPKNATIASLDRDRISQRLIGNFAFAVTGRSLDGGLYTAGDNTTNITVMAARPDRCCFQVDGWGEVDVDVAYAALTHLTGGEKNASQIRVFGIQYNDFRDNVLKTDNRSATARGLDHKDIDIQTVGADYVGTTELAGNSFDLLLWGVAQGGTWGTLRQRAYAYATEGGWQAPIERLKPWFRAGLDYSSGDHNPNDGVHGTFFSILPTPRGYARFPFFNSMNNRDAFVELILRPTKSLTLRSDIHSLALANSHDLWYSGGGAFQPWTFGYTGRPSGGNRGLATLYDISADYTMTRHSAVTLYYGHASGKMVIEALYPKDPNGNLGYVELNYRF